MAEAETLPQSVQDLVQQYGWTGEIAVAPPRSFIDEPGTFSMPREGRPDRLTLPWRHSPEMVQQLTDAGFDERAISSGETLFMTSLARQYLGDEEYIEIIDSAARAEDRLPTLRDLGVIDPVDIDIRAMQREGRAQGLSQEEVISNIARTVADMVGYNYDILSNQYQGPANVDGFSDAKIIETFANINVGAGPLQAVASGFAQTAPPTMAAVTAFQRMPGGWGFKLPAAIAAFFTSDTLMREMFPQIQSERFLPGLQPWYYFGSFAGSEAPFATIPFGVGKGEISLGKDFLTGVINTNFGKLPGFNRVFVGGRNVAGKGEEWLEKAFEAARQNPGIFTTQQLYQGILAAGAGAGIEAIAPDANIVQFLTEGATAFLPTSYLSNMAPRIWRGTMDLKSKLTASGREANMADWMVESIDEINRMMPGELNSQQTLDVLLDHLVLEQSEGRPVSRLVFGDDARPIPREPVSSNLSDLLREAGISLTNQTTALASGLPFFAILQQRALDNVDKMNLSLSQKKILREQMESANNLMRLYMGTLVATGDESALSLARELQQGVMTAEVEQLIATTLANYNRLYNNARREGSTTFDADRALYNVFIGENPDSPSLLNDLRRQENVLFDAIPSELQASTTNLVAAYTAAMQRFGILGEKPRISSGNDLVFLDRVLEQFDHIAHPERYKRPQIEKLQEDLGTRATEVSEKLKTDTDKIRADLKVWEANRRRRAREQGVGKTTEERRTYRRIAQEDILARRRTDQNRITQMEEKAEIVTTTAGSTTASKIKEIQAELMAASDITSGDLNNMRKNLQQAINNASRVGNNEHKELLQMLYDGALADLSGIEIPVGNGHADTIERILNTAIDFELVARRTVNRTFVGDMGRGDLNQRPELIGQELFKGSKDDVMMRHVEMKRAIMVLDEQNRSTFGALGLANEAAAARAVERGEDAYGEILREINPEGRLRDVKAASDNILFGVINEPRFWNERPVKGPDGKPRIDAQGNAVTQFEPTPAFKEWLELNTPMLEEFHPEILEDLTDLQKVNKLFDNPITPDSPMYKQAVEKLAFLNAFAIPDPAAAVRHIIGTPGTAARARGTSVRELRRFSELAMDEGKTVANGFMQSVLHDAWLYAKGAMPADLIGPQAGRPKLDLNRFYAYLFDPLVKGGDSVMQVLNKTGVIEDEAVRVWKNLLEMMSDFQRLDNAAGVEDLLRSVENTRGASYILPFVRRLVGAQVGARAGKLLPGGVATIQAPAFGAQLFEQLLSNLPSSKLDDAFFALVNDPEVAADWLAIGLRRQGQRAGTTPNLRNINIWLAGWGGTTLEEAALFEEEREAIRESFLNRGAQWRPSNLGAMGRNRNPPEEVEEVVVEETEEVDLSPAVGYTTTPPQMPPLTMPQGQASTAQVSTDQDAYAAAFPYDSVSEVIRARQGLGGLS
jgi:hypothetical protein